jgi:hypothetical protein
MPTTSAISAWVESLQRERQDLTLTERERPHVPEKPLGALPRCQLLVETGARSPPR